MSERAERTRQFDGASRTRLIPILRTFVLVLVAAGLVMMAIRCYRELQDSPLDLRQLRLGWLLLAGPLYALGMFTAAMFWHRVLHRLGLHVSASRAYSAFFFSQLGKYLPGKAMVIVLRVAAIRRPGVSMPLAVLSVFVETLSWMAVGAAVGCIALAIASKSEPWLLAMASTLAALAIVGTSPPLLGWIVRRLRRGEEGTRDVPVRRLSWGLLGMGWLELSVGWLLVSLSLWSVVRAFPMAGIGAADFPLTIACATLSIVLGFASLIPGGLGVRELVIAPLLATRFGTPTALTAAVLARVVWMGAELTLAAIMKWYLSRSANAGRTAEVR